MTREEAIEIYQSIFDDGYKNGYAQARFDYGVKEIIREIKQEPTEETEQEPIPTTNNDEPITIIYPTIVCDDAISREAVIKDFTQWRGKMAYSIGEDYSGVSVLDKVIRVIKGMPSVTQKSGKWISVSERLPEDAYGCLVTVYDTDLKTQDEFENILPYFVGYDGETWNNADGEPIPFEVIAWMPLPKPYEPQEREEQTDAT